MNVEQRQAAADPQTKPHDLGYESAFRQLSSTTTIAIYYYYSARKLGFQTYMKSTIWSLIKYHLYWKEHALRGMLLSMLMKRRNSNTGSGKKSELLIIHMQRINHKSSGANTQALWVIQFDS